MSTLCGGVPVRVEASGRTDAGVHAASQIVAVTTPAGHSVQTLTKGVNALLPADIACLRVDAVPLDFDPRRWALGKHYRYRLLIRRPRCPFRSGRTWHLRSGVDCDLITRASRHLVGRHDFSSFRAAGCGAHHAVRNLEAIEVEKQGDEVHLNFFGNGFLRHQVRIMVGTLVEVGQGRRSAESVQEALIGRERQFAGKTAPPQGLWLMSVRMGSGPRIPVESAESRENGSG